SPVGQWSVAAEYRLDGGPPTAVASPGFGVDDPSRTGLTWSLDAVPASARELDLTVRVTGALGRRWTFRIPLPVAATGPLPQPATGAPPGASPTPEATRTPPPVRPPPAAAGAPRVAAPPAGLRETRARALGRFAADPFGAPRVDRKDAKLVRLGALPDRHGTTVDDDHPVWIVAAAGELYRVDAPSRVPEAPPRASRPARAGPPHAS